MITWILILSTWGYGLDSGMLSTEFADRSACLAAANAWLRQSREARPYYSHRALCVPKASKQ